MSYTQRDYNLIVWFYGACEDLHKWKLITGSNGHVVTPKGIAKFDQLIASGFKPTDQELLTCVVWACSKVNLSMHKLLQLYRDKQLDQQKEIL